MVAVTRAKRKAAAEASRTGDLPEQPKRKAAEEAASRTGDLPEQPKPKPKAKAKRRRAAVGPPPEVLQRACVITKDTLGFGISVTLRSGRDLWVRTNKAKPGPLKFRKGEEALYDISWRTPACARIALKYYNRMNKDKLELVKAVDSIEFFFNGHWMHANFLAKSEGGTSCADLVPKLFFAELKMVPGGNIRMACVSCIQMDQGNPEKRPVRGCGICPSRIFHPADGGHIAASGQGAGQQASNVDAMGNA